MRRQFRLRDLRPDSSSALRKRTMKKKKKKEEEEKKKNRTTPRSTLDSKIEVQINYECIDDIWTRFDDSYSVVDADPSSTLEELMDDADAVFDGPSKDILFLDGRDLLRENLDSSLCELGIHNGTILMLGYCGRFVIRFSCVNIWYMIEMDSSDTVRSLKQEIEKTTGIPMDEQKLKFKGVALLELGRTLLSYGIFRKSQELPICDIIIHLTEATREDYASMAGELFKDSIPLDFLRLDEANPSAGEMQIKVKTGYGNKPFTMNLNPMGLLSTLKLTLHRKFGFRNEQLILFLNGKNLLEDSSLEDSSLESCGIKTGVTLLLGYKGRFLVSFCRWNCAVEYLAEVDCFDTVSMLKEKILKTVGGSKNPFLIHADTKVILEEPERTLFSYGIFRRKIGGEIHDIIVRQPRTRKYRAGMWYA